MSHAKMFLQVNGFDEEWKKKCKTWKEDWIKQLNNFENIEAKVDSQVVSLLKERNEKLMTVFYRKLKKSSSNGENTNIQEELTTFLKRVKAFEDERRRLVKKIAHKETLSTEEVTQFRTDQKNLLSQVNTLFAEELSEEARAFIAALVMIPIVIGTVGLTACFPIAGMLLIPEVIFLVASLKTSLFSTWEEATSPIRTMNLELAPEDSQDVYSIKVSV